ncbi:hypothetical protein [Pseudomonas sp. TMB3-21]
MINKTITALPPCDDDVFKNGKSVCLVDISKDAAEDICRNLSAATGCKVDWHYIGGRVHIKALATPVVERQDEQQMACMPVERCYDVRAKMIIAFNEAGMAGGDLDDRLGAAYKAALRYSPNPLLNPLPAPATVVLDERKEFVAWVRREWPQAPLSLVRDLLPKDDPRYGEYCDEALQRAWVGWQARGALAGKS